ncbi:hypothetical protein Q1I10_000797 [Enterococcus faecium]|nr:hypothetical protein [Enterococcus faecium]EME3553470.1 hypothetical protein [Enterococcus faecium]
MESVTLIDLAEQGHLTKTGARPKLPIQLPNVNESILDVYRIPLNYLYYNNENGRIASAVTRAQMELSPERDDDNPEYNIVVEDMIVEDDATKLRATKKDIKKNSQQVPGYVLSDGRVIDGNRRFTALRQLARESGETYYFEAVILPFSYESKNERAEIKRLELAIQMGVEEKKSYDPVDLAVDTYQTVVADQLLTAADYAKESRSTKKDVENRIETVGLMQDYLEFINATPNAYHIIKDTKLYTPLFELAKKLARQFPHKGPSYEQSKLTTFALLSKMLSVGEDTGREIRVYFKEVLASNENNNFNDVVEDKIEDLRDKLEETTITSAGELRKALAETTPELRSINEDYVQTVNRQNRGKSVESFISDVKESLNSLEDMKKGGGLIGNLSFFELGKDQVKEIRDLLIQINITSRELIDIYENEV